MAKVEDEIYQPGSLGGAPMAQKMDRVCNMTMAGTRAVDSCIGDSPIGRVTNTLNLESTKAQPDKRHGFVTFEEFMPSIGDGMMDTGDLIPKIQAMSRK